MAGGSRPLLVLGRVSTASRRELVAHLDTALIAHLHIPEVARIYRAALQPGVLAKGPAGVAARTGIGWETVYAPGTTRELGVLARDADVRVLLMNASAASRDLGEDSNAFVEVLCGVFSAPDFRGRDPHAPAQQRPAVLAPFLDRLVRDQELGWRVFNAAQRAYVVFCVDGSEIDTLSHQASDNWTMGVWSAAKSRADTRKRLANGELNLYRAGHYGGAEAQLPRGYRFEQEPMPDGTWRRAGDATRDSRIAHHVEPDPEAWWEVQAVIRAALDPAVTTWVQLADRLGAAGLTARGKDEDGVQLSALQDLRSAARLALDPRVIEAWRTGLLAYETVGVGHGTWTLPGGHKFTPRWDGDECGAIRYTVNVGVPEWPRGFDDADLDAVLAKWWPAGKPAPMPTGRAAGAGDRHALAGVIGWTEGGYRYEVLAHGDRYNLRRQHLPTAARRADGEVVAMREDTTDLVASWRSDELCARLADLLEQATSTLLGDHPDTAIEPLLHLQPATRPRGADTRSAEITRLNAAIDHAEKQALGAHEASNDCYADGQKDLARRKLADAARFEADAAQLRAQLAEVTASPAPDTTPTGRRHLDVATPAAVIAALRSPFATGSGPVELNRAVKRLLGDRTRIELGPTLNRSGFSGGCVLPV